MRGSCLLRSGQVPAEVSCLEAHGTGTALGDPTECRALIAVLGVCARKPLVVSAGKASVAHSDGAAGADGLLHGALIFHGA